MLQAVKAALPVEVALQAEAALQDCNAMQASVDLDRVGYISCTAPSVNDEPATDAEQRRNFLSRLLMADRWTRQSSSFDSSFDLSFNLYRCVLRPAQSLNAKTSGLNAPIAVRYVSSYIQSSLISLYTSSRLHWFLRTDPSKLNSNSLPVIYYRSTHRSTSQLLQTAVE